MTKQRRTTQPPEQKQSNRSHAARKTRAHGPVSHSPVADALLDTSRLQHVADHAQATAGDVMSQQAHSGNRAVQRLLASHQVQTELAVGPVHDRYKQEADRVAERVMSIPRPSSRERPRPDRFWRGTDHAAGRWSHPARGSAQGRRRRAARGCDRFNQHPHVDGDRCPAVRAAESN